MTSSTLKNSGRLDLTLYAERLDRMAERVADELADARLLEAWCAIDEEVRAALDPSHVLRLEDLGVLFEPDQGGREVALRTMQERAADLSTLHTAQNVVRDLIAAKRAAAGPPHDPTAFAPVAGEPDYVSVVMIVDASTDEGQDFLQRSAVSCDAVVHSSGFTGVGDALRWLSGMGNAHREQAAADLANYEQEG